MISRKEAIEALEVLLSGVEWNAPLCEALEQAIKSMELWDGFIEKLAERCNAASSGEEWDVYRKGIELIKESFGEKIG